nr:MAG: capsid protein [Cressdnaviricota sp.]
MSSRRPSRYKGVFRANPYAASKALAIGRKLGKISAARAVAASGDAQMNRIMSSVSFAGSQGNLGRRGVGIRGETKGVDNPTAIISYQLNSAVAGVLLNQVQEGAGFNQRIGRKICAKSVYVNGHIGAATTGPFAEESLRLLLVWDYQPNGANASAAMVWTDLIQAVDGASGVTNTTLDGLNLNNRDRFKVLRDEKFYMPGNNIVAPNNQQYTSNWIPTMSEVEVKWYVKLPNLETQFNSTSNPITFANINNGALYLIAQGTTGGQYRFVYTSRFRYEDN